MLDNIKKPAVKIYELILEEIKKTEDLADKLKDKSPMELEYLERKFLKEELFYLHEIRRNIERFD